jgi:hypothetical protein
MPQVRAAVELVVPIAFAHPMHKAHVRGYVGVTDDDWYNFLAARPDLKEVNFWRPGVPCARHR